jgi:hypothetical protein
MPNPAPAARPPVSLAVARALRNLERLLAERQDLLDRLEALTATRSGDRGGDQPITQVAADAERLAVEAERLLAELEALVPPADRGGAERIPPAATEPRRLDA